MDIDEEQRTDEEQVEVDVLPDVASDSEGSDGADGEPEVDEPEEYELDDEDDEIQESRSPSIVAPPPRSPLKIKFKVRRGAAPVARGRRTTRATAQAAQVESEDSESSEEEMPQNVRLTKRQAALVKARKGIVTSDTSADEEPEPEPSVPSRKRGAALDPSEVALRKEESARKRRNVSEKKLQDEKAETINRLLKKQTRPRNKRSTAVSVPTPVEVPTPVAPSERAGSVGDGMEDVNMPDAERLGDAPTMYRWISTSRPRAFSSVENGESGKREEEPAMSISFGVPVSVMTSAVGLQSPFLPPEDEKPKPKVPALCGVTGCGKDRRYRLVGGEWGVGACGMAHLKVLEGR
ncbi:PAPA-1 domain-containing protein [Favolaschia claudopus]|uniref:PAPA-1 domain-containing protein n=1 Tax=Favolaschia claudopus TaxID=2862362 RepID=A0AAW0A769_9AGAR